jgi:hypothetical protein
MVNISLIVKDYLDTKPFIQEGLYKGIISQGYLANEIKPFVDKKLGDNIKVGSIVIAIRRYSEKLLKKSFNQFPIIGEHEITLKSNICEITILRSPTIFSKINRLYGLIDYNQGGLLNLIQGTYEITIITNMGYKEKILNLFKDEKIEKINENLVALSLKYSKEYYDIPGQIFTYVRALSWENINICEYISTLTESIFILYEKDALKAYNVFQELFKNI